MVAVAPAADRLALTVPETAYLLNMRRSSRFGAPQNERMPTSLE